MDLQSDAMEHEHDNVDLNRIISDLDHQRGDRLREAVRAAQQHRELIIPRLIKAIEDATAEVRSTRRRREGNAQFFALFLLTEFRAREALPAIAEAISLPENGAYYLFGEAITECLGRMLAILADDSLALIDGLLADRSLDDFVRTQVAMSYMFLVAKGRLTREEAVERLRVALREAISHDDLELAEGLVCELSDYSPREALPEIEEAYRQKLVDPFMISIEDVRESIAEGDAHFQEELARRTGEFCTDTLEELDGWTCFKDEQFDEEDDDFDAFDSEDWDEERYLNDAADDFGEPGFADLPRDSSDTIRNTTPRVGRNDPCPCGSGKKYKKCCGKS